MRDYLAEATILSESGETLRRRRYDGSRGWPQPGGDGVNEYVTGAPELTHEVRPLVGEQTVLGSSSATASGVASRADLFRYVVADNADEYRALMSLFAGPLLADLSAAEAASALAESGLRLSTDEVNARCEQLERWGNLVRGVRDARVATVRDYLRSRTRFQASKLGGRVYRDTEELLAAGAGAREVARELLGAVVDTLDRIITRLDRAGTGQVLDVDALAADVTTVFNNQQLFNESVRDFYTYLNAVLSRYDLAGAEYQQFKTMLLDYVDLITADVVRHAPAAQMRFETLEPHLHALLAALAGLPVLTMPDGSRAERLPGRTLEEWEALRGWYTGRDGRSGPEGLRAAADAALGQLITNAKRMLATAGTGMSRRADLLKLAGWFDQADTDTAHRLYAATFGTHSARHLLLGPDEPVAVDGPSTSWWDATAVDVPMSLRDRGDRSARGRSSSVPDPGLDAAALLSAAEAEAARRHAAAAELLAAGALHDAHVSPAARDLLMERTADLLAVHQELDGPVSSTDSDLGLTVHAAPEPGAVTVVHADDGSVTVHGLRLTACPAGTGAVLTDAKPAQARQVLA